MTQQYNNALDSWYQDCPWPVQRVLESPYQTVSGWLRFVTGDPNKVAGYGPVYEAIGREVERRVGNFVRKPVHRGQFCRMPVILFDGTWIVAPGWEWVYEGRKNENSTSISARK